jgi:[acyl-carrier-protein] S-malonyltransferase
MKKQRIALLFPGQGTQYIGMGHDFFREYPLFRHIVEEAEDREKTNFSDLIFTGDPDELTKTKNSQRAIFIISYAMFQVLKTILGDTIEPVACAGLSLGEYSALAASNKIAFDDALFVVSKRGFAMEEAAIKNPGTMACILGLDDAAIVDIVNDLKMQVVCANYNCPGQVIISGTHQAVDEATASCLAKGARRVLKLSVGGAFHSPLMKEAKEAMKPHIASAPITSSPIRVLSNVTGNFVDDVGNIKELLIEQITSPVRWHETIKNLEASHIDLYVEIGPGTTLTNLNKRIGTRGTSLHVEKVEDIKPLEQLLS